jgi:hypothetical protein
MRLSCGGSLVDAVSSESTICLPVVILAPHRYRAKFRRRPIFPSTLLGDRHRHRNLYFSPAVNHLRKRMRRPSRTSAKGGWYEWLLWVAATKFPNRRIGGATRNTTDRKGLAYDIRWFLSDIRTSPRSTLKLDVRFRRRSEWQL